MTIQQFDDGPHSDGEAPDTSTGGTVTNEAKLEWETGLDELTVMDAIEKLRWALLKSTLP